MKFIYVVLLFVLVSCQPPAVAPLPEKFLAPALDIAEEIATYAPTQQFGSLERLSVETLTPQKVVLFTRYPLPNETLRVTFSLLESDGYTLVTVSGDNTAWEEIAENIMAHLRNTFSRF
jgi:hypothetical protein